MKCLLRFPRELCCPLALVKKRVSRFPVPRPRAPQRAAHGEIREFQPAREGSEHSVLLPGHGQKYPGKTRGGGTLKEMREATPFLEQIDAKIPGFSKVKISSSGVL